MTQQNKVQWIYSSKNNQELEERYDQWAREYDKDLGEEFGWVGPQRVADVFAEFTSKDDKVLDAGAGTGLVGVALAKKGYTHITAMDLSNGMLDVAEATGAYEARRREEMGKPLSFETGEFDAVVSVGTLTIGHAPPSSLDELVRVTRVGGRVIFSMRPDHYESGGFKEKQTELEQAGRWKLVHKSDQFPPLPKGEPEVMYEVWVYEVLP